MTKWALALILLMFATGYGFPVYFTERLYQTLEQLDEALANNEISQEYYDELVDAFSGCPEANPAEEQSPDDSEPSDKRAVPRWKYSSNYKQQLQSSFNSTRYDAINYKGKGISASLGLEQLSKTTTLVRSIAISIAKPDWRLNLGNLSFQYANGLTTGRNGLHRELHNDDDFTSSLVYPTRNRRNGIEFERELGDIVASIYLSCLQGVHYYLQSYGCDFRMLSSAADFGLIALRQQSGERAGRTQAINYLAPHTRIGNQNRKVSAESSFQIGGASAHSLRGEFHSGQSRRTFEFFSYGVQYHNLESGGYAYSDYDVDSIDAIGLEYRDKRPGRIGVAIDQSFSLDAETISGQFVRWDNRSDNRKCVAARAIYCHQDRVRVQAIYQDLDIESGSDTRALVAVGAKVQSARSISYENQLKLEQRVLNGNKKYPFRSRHDFAWQIDPRFKTIGMINYYDGDLSSHANAQLTLAAGFELASTNALKFTARCQSRYRFAVRRFDNWELRVNLEATL